MQNGADSSEYDVVIIGGGPVGTMLAVLLGQQGKKVNLVERWTESYARPRAVTYDHEIARILAMLGVDSENDPAINFHDELYYWKNAEREILQIVDWQSTSASGWRVRYWFNQPELEGRLTRLASTYDCITQTRGFEAVNLDERDDHVAVTLKRNQSEEPGSDEVCTVKAKYVVGADGANSFVRQSLGIENVDKGYFFDWLILDMLPGFDYVASRPDEPAQWQLCDPTRPTTIVPGGPGPDPQGPARRRWEFMLLPGETAEEMQAEDNAWKLLEPWGLTPENSVLERSAVYRFQALWAPVWNKGRCMIAGDAAHLMPPFAGEGMCAGLRDAFALSWRLNGILDGNIGPEVLDSYSTERIEHVKHYIDFSQELGSIICIDDPEQAAQRDAQMKAELAARNNAPVPTDICQLGPGVWCPESAHAGELSVQGAVDVNGNIGRFDQVFGAGWIMLAYEHDPREVLRDDQRNLFRAMGGQIALIGPPGSRCDAVDVEGTYAKWLKDIDAKYVLLRPDFYVAVTASSPENLRDRFDDVMSRLRLTEKITGA